jgi:hypothetical protein
MKNITLSIDEELLEKSREVAAWQGTSLNGLIRKMLTKITEMPQQQDWFSGFELVSEQVTGDSGGWKFNREELYDE